MAAATSIRTALPMTNTDLTIGRPGHRDAHAASRSDAAMSRFEISIHDTMAPLEQEWRSLEALSFNSLHQGYDWCAAWAQAHDSELQVVRGALDGELLFILPLEFVPGRLFNTARFVGAPHSNLNTGLFAADALTLPRNDFADRLARELTHRLRHKVDLVALEKTPLAWRGTASPFANLPGIKNQNSSFQLPLFSSFERTLAQVNAKRRRKKMRISERRLEALGGTTTSLRRIPAKRGRCSTSFFARRPLVLQLSDFPMSFRAPRPERSFTQSRAVAAQLTNDCSNSMPSALKANMAGGLWPSPVCRERPIMSSVNSAPSTRNWQATPARASSCSTE